ncbi:hypothetical protein [Tichowtungia aerotolerans]|uniref:Uncharacterized protein n=1 Tax=Tichowtungia aerotolerans TaxID=2697043 RepID=A0A6P1M6X6_9BACT|nr:hypothetical protein [Tichowtungia aerotolerans]QHI68763.1 hypothetical protein GT409_04635 [Tichowtungia aerotolerans]
MVLRESSLEFGVFFQTGLIRSTVADALPVWIMTVLKWPQCAVCHPTGLCRFVTGTFGAMRPDNLQRAESVNAPAHS